MALFDDASEPRPGGPGPSSTDPDAHGVARWDTPPPPPPASPSVGVPGEAAAPPDLTDPAVSEAPTTTPDTGRRSRRLRKARKRKPSTVRSLVEWGVVIGGALLVALVIRTFLLAAYYIPSPSMVATLEEGDRVLVNKLSYHLHGVHRGDIVVFSRPPSEPDTGIEDYIKRVIGLPGDVIDLQDCHVTVNGRPLTESYVHDPQGQNCTRPLSQPLPYTVPAGDVWVMGDNRGVSVDSRQFGAIPESSIVGRAFLRIWPLSHLGFL